MQLLVDLVGVGRGLARNSFFALSAAGLLCLGFAVNTGAFAFYGAVFVSPLPFQQPDRLAQIVLSKPDREKLHHYFGYQQYRSWRDHSQLFQGLAAIKEDGRENRVYFSAPAVDEPDLLRSAQVSTNYFSLLGVKPRIGRTFDGRDSGQEVVLSHKIWASRFGSEPGVIGQRILLNDSQFDVIGVMPAGFRRHSSLGPIVDFWIPLTPSQIDWDGLSYRIVGCLKPGIGSTQAVEELTVIRGASSDSAGSSSSFQVEVVRLHEEKLRHLHPYAVALNGIAALVLIVVCVNAAALILVRRIGRAHELAVRAALGAGRLRLIRASVLEGILLSMAGFAASLPIAYWLIELANSFSPQDFPWAGQISLHGYLIALAFLLALCCGLLLGMFSALHPLERDLENILRQPSAGRWRSKGGFRLDSVVTIETALAVILLIGAGLMARSFWNLRQIDLGFNPHRVLAMDVHLPWSKDESQATRFFEELAHHLRSLPKTIDVALCSSVPLRPRDYFLRGGARLRKVDARYFELLGIPLLQGRSFASSDDLGSSRVAIVNETLRRQLFAGEDPIGRMVLEDFEIVGVVADVRHQGIDSADKPAVYIHHLQRPDRRMSVLLRSQGDPLELVPAVRSRLRALDKRQPLTQIARLNDVLTKSEAVVRHRTFLGIMGGFGIAALVLTAIGIYSITSHRVLCQLREIGIRMALGADRRRILNLFISQGIRTIGAGLFIGLLASLAMSRLLAGFLFQITPQDPLTFIIISLTICITGLIGTWRPALRAASIETADILKSNN